MAFRNSINRVTGIRISGEVDSSAEYSQVPNGTFFNDLSTGKTMYKPSDGGTPFEYKPSKFINGSKLFPIDPIAGIDAALATNEARMLKTLEYAHGLMDGSGQRAELMPGTHGAGESITLSKSNAVYQAIGRGNGNTYINKQVTLSNASSNQHLVGLALNTVISNSAGNNFLTDCSITSGNTLAKSGAGYLEVKNTDLSVIAINITGAGRCVFEGGYIGFVTINNSLAQVAIRNAGSVVQPNLVSGLLLIDGATIYAPANGQFAVNTSAGTFAYFINCKFVNPDNTPAKVNTQGYASFIGCTYLEAGSTISATNILNTVSNFDALKTFGTITAGGSVIAKAINNPWVLSNSYNQNDIVLYNGSKLIRANGNIPANTAVVFGTSGATWTDLSGSGSGGTVTIIKHQVKGYVDVSASFQPSFDGKYIIKNKALINNTVFPTLSTANDNDIWQLAATVWIRVLDISTVTESGETQVFFENEDNPRFYSTVGGWKTFYPNEYEEVTVTGSVMPFFGGNRTFENGTAVFRQSSIGKVNLVGSPNTINSNGFQEIESVVEADRQIVVTKYSGNTTEFKWGIINPNGTITYSSPVALGNCFNFKILKSPTGGIVIIQGLDDATRMLSVRLYVWNGSVYVQAGSTVTYDTGSAGINSFSACINANNTLELNYNVQSGANKIACVFVGASSLTKYTEEQISASNILVLGLFSFGVAGRSVLFYRNGSILTAKACSRNTNGTRTFDASEIPMPTQSNNHEFLRATSRNGDMLLMYQYNNQTFCRWLNGNSSQFTMTDEAIVYNSHLFAIPAFSGSATVGTALINTSTDIRPQAIGFVKNGDSISLAFPSTVIGSQAEINQVNGASISFDNTNFVYSFVSSTSGVYTSQGGVLSYEALAEVVSDFVFLDAAVDGGKSRIARNNQVVTNFPNVENGRVYYFNAGLITTTPTKIVAGLGGVSGLIVGIVDNTALNALSETVSGHTSTLASQSSTISGHETRITTLESNSGVKVGWRFPDFSIGWGMAMIYSDGIRDNVIGGGSNSQYRGFGDLENDGLITQHHIDFNGNIADENAFTGFAEIRYNTRNGIARSKEGKLFMFGRENQYGQLGDGTTVNTTVNGRAGKWVLQTQPEVYGANLFVTKVDISEDWWGDDASRCTLLVTVRNTSTNVFNGYMRGFSSNGTGDGWCIISSNNPNSGGGAGSTPVKGSVLPWTKIFANPANIVGAALGVHQAHIIVDEGTNKRLLFSGLNQTGCSGNGAALNFEYSSYQQCIYEDGSHVLNAKWIKNVYSNIGANTVFMINTAGKPFSCGYQGGYNSGFGTTSNEFRFKAMWPTIMANRTVVQILVFREAVCMLLDNDDLYYAGYSQNYVGTNGTSNFKNGVNTDIVNGNPVILNGYYQTPILMAQGIDKIWSNGTRGNLNDYFIYMRRRATKEVLYTGYALNNTSLADNTNNNATNYARVIHKPSAGEWIEDLHVDGGKTDAGTWVFATTVITNKGNVYRTGLDNTLTGRVSTIDRTLVKWKRVLTEYETK